MVLGFGSKKKKGGDEHVVRVSPSLPEMSTQGLSWPSDLVDAAAIQQAPFQVPARGAARVSFSTPENGAIPFHRPFRTSIAKSPALNGNGKNAGPNTGSIASLYMSSHPPTAFGAKPENRASTPRSTRSRHSHSLRRRVAPTFNLMVVGAQGTGKVRNLEEGTYTFSLIITEFSSSSSHR